jgi:putative transposase
MPLRKVQFCPGEFYHIYNRDKAKQDIFYNDRDRYRFLQAMYLSNNSNSFIGIEELERNKSGYTLVEIKNILENNKVIYNPLVRICADCLMPNHFHFFVQEIQNNGIVRFMQRLGNSYGKYFTIKYERPGSLFQGRFKAVHIENDNQLNYLLVYINVINPAQLVEFDLKERGIENFNEVWEKINDYSWSTHQEYMGKRESIIIDKGLLGRVFPTPKVYCEFVKDILRGKEKNVWGMLDGLALD